MRVVGIALPSIFSVVYAVAAFLVYRERGPSRRHRAEDNSRPLSEEEMQRRQLLRLLQEQDPAVPSPGVVQNTYRLDIDLTSLDPKEIAGAEVLVPQP